ncbi:hypothetical protein Aerorivi_02405 [Aeromonas rivipollensis]|uniref:hypothetical protein n=1 Tax=Aeromonas TaxID=642 RepID=UPI0029540B19|nr:hypothetical protein [Aeromonas media]WOQ15173.1 hypothetical protein R2X36_10150 [Aeromonas media]
MSEWKGLPDGFEPIQGTHYGFIYHIRNNVTGKRYIGSKQFFSHVKETRKSDPKFGKKVYKPSKWESYKSSNEKVAGWADEDITKTILMICGGKFELQYAECKALIDSKALLDDNFENYMLSSFMLGRPPASMRFDSLEEKYTNAK